MRTGANSKPADLPSSFGAQYLSAKQSAELLGVNRATVVNWARQGKIGGFQYGKRGIYRFRRQEIIDFLNESRIPTPVGPTDVVRRRAGGN